MHNPSFYFGNLHDRRHRCGSTVLREAAVGHAVTLYALNCVGKKRVVFLWLLIVENSYERQIILL